MSADPTEADLADLENDAENEADRDISMLIRSLIAEVRRRRSAEPLHQTLGCRIECECGELLNVLERETFTNATPTAPTLTRRMKLARCSNCPTKMRALLKEFVETQPDDYGSIAALNTRVATFLGPPAAPGGGIKAKP